MSALAAAVVIENKQQNFDAYYSSVPSASARRLTPDTSTMRNGNKVGAV